ncbi:LysE family translocator [Stella sp.]|uniref:LysE family translocator n=1 Tax=Stella sp. TaxID=2912054 RepID=UPI0035B42254
MFDPLSFALSLAAALVVAATPGPGILYVAARTLAGGRADGIASSVGTGIGGMAHVAAGAVGLSALLLASAELFTLLKLAGAAYLVLLGIRTIRAAGTPIDLARVGAGSRPVEAFRQGIVVEALNPKTAAFFLAFLPQFVDPSRGGVAVQFVVLGTISVLLNTGADVVAAAAADFVRRNLFGRPSVIRRLRQASGGVLCGLGLLLAFARRPQAG